MATFTARVASPDDYDLAEGPVYDPATDHVHWVDIWRGRLLSGALRESGISDVVSRSLGQTAGAVALTADGGLLIAAARGLACISPEGTLAFGPDLLGERTDARLNDGTVDAQGRFVVGTVAVGSPSSREVLLRISPDGLVETLRTGIRLSNGVAFSPDGDTIYHVDTLSRTISKHSYGPGAFESREPWTVILSDLNWPPDGLTVGSDGGLWIAMWGGSQVHHYSTTGQLKDVVLVDAAQVTCPAFVGTGLDLLAISTAHEGLEEWSDQSGSIFLANVAMTGLPANRWSGSTRAPYWLDSRAVREK